MTAEDAVETTRLLENRPDATYAQLKTRDDMYCFVNPNRMDSWMDRNVWNCYVGGLDRLQIEIS